MNLQVILKSKAIYSVQVPGEPMEFGEDMKERILDGGMQGALVLGSENDAIVIPMENIDYFKASNNDNAENVKEVEE